LGALAGDAVVAEHRRGYGPRGGPSPRGQELHASGLPVTPFAAIASSREATRLKAGDRLEFRMTAREYVLEPNEAEVARLLAYAEREVEQVRLACRQAELAAGGRVIDVGCGPLGALKVLAEIVGESGFVAGIEENKITIAVARRVLDQIGLQRVELIESDIHLLNRPEWDRWFDLAYCRLVLLHQEAPGKTLQAIGRLVRPGGYVIYQDVLDEPTFPRSEPAVPEAHRAWELLFRTFEHKGLSPGVARDHGVLCRQLGWELAAQRGKFAVTSGAEGLAVIQNLLAASERTILQEGLATQEDLTCLKTALAQWHKQEFRYWFGPIAIETVARVP
jgi:SAM-dependent methyltransferase